MLEYLGQILILYDKIWIWTSKLQKTYRDIEFFGSLSLHLNHLIGLGMGICYWQFGTLPIGIFLSNLDSRQLDTSLIIYYGHF